MIAFLSQNNLRINAKSKKIASIFNGNCKHRKKEYYKE